MKIKGYFEEDTSEYEDNEPIRDDDGLWTTVGELRDRYDEYGDLLDDEWDYDPGPDCEKSLDIYERNLEYNWKY